MKPSSWSLISRSCRSQTAPRHPALPPEHRLRLRRHRHRADRRGRDAQPAGRLRRGKLAGEEAVRAALASHQIVRTAWLYGQEGPNFVLTMLRLARERGALRVVADQWGSPTWTGHLAPALVRLVERGVPGTYHLTNSGSTSWHGFAQAIVEEAGLSVPVEAIQSCRLPDRLRPGPLTRCSPTAPGRVWGRPRCRPGGMHSAPTWRSALPHSHTPRQRDRRPRARQRARQPADGRSLHQVLRVRPGAERRRSPGHPGVPVSQRPPSPGVRGDHLRRLEPARPWSRGTASWSFRAGSWIAFPSSARRGRAWSSISTTPSPWRFSSSSHRSRWRSGWVLSATPSGR